MAVNYALFVNADPPEDDGIASVLFVDREDEMQTAKEELLSAIAFPLRKILVVVGLARMGKSHFLKKLYNEPDVREECHSVIVLKAAQGITDERTALRLIFEQQRQHLAYFYENLAPEDRRRWQPSMELLKQINDYYGSAMAGDAVKITEETVTTLTRGITEQRALKGNLSLKVNRLLSSVTGIEPQISGALESGTQDATGVASGQRQSIERQVQPFTADRLRQLVELVHMLCRQLRPDWRTLLVVDDFDLLKRRSDDKSFDPIPLQNELYALSQVDGVYVLATVRLDTFGMHQKSFYSLVSLQKLPVNRLKEIYQRHVDQFMQGTGPFAGAFVDEAAVKCDGRVGLFLESLKLAYKDRRTLPMPLESLTFQRYLTLLWEQIQTNAHKEAQILLRASARPRGLLELDEAAQVRNSAANSFILDDYSSVDAVVIKPYLLPFLQEQAAAAT